MTKRDKNRALFRIDHSSTMGPCNSSLVLTAIYGKIMVTANIAKILATDVKSFLRTSKNKVYRKCQQIDPTLDP